MGCTTLGGRPEGKGFVVGVSLARCSARFRCLRNMGEGRRRTSCHHLADPSCQNLDTSLRYGGKLRVTYVHGLVFEAACLPSNVLPVVGAPQVLDCAIGSFVQCFRLQLWPASPWSPFVREAAFTI